MWADEVTFDFNGKLSTLSTVTNKSTSLESAPITLTFTSANSARSVQVNQTDKIIKFQGPDNDTGDAGTSLTVSCPTGGMYAITKVEILTGNSNISNFSVSNGNYTSEGSSSSYKGTWTDEDAGNITSVTFQTTSNVDAVKSFTITYADNRSEPSTDFKFNPGDEYYSGTGGGLYVNSTAFNTDNSAPFEFVYDATKTTIHAKLNLIAAMNATAADFSVTSSNADVLDVSSGSFRIANSTRVYLDGIQVKSAGTANLTFTYKGSNTYKPATRTVTFNVKAPNTTFAGNYKYTWTFNDGVWENSKLQSAYYTNSDENSTSRKWTINTTAEARNVGNIPANNGIEKIQGLAFTAVDGGLCLDWTNNCIWLNGSVTIPNLVKGQVITFTAVTGATITCTNNSTTLTESSGTYTYTVTDNAPDGLTFSVDGKHIYSIAVSNSQYGWEYTTESATLDGTSRKIKGTFTFTEEGPIAGGTVIDEVPGITMTVGTSTDSWNVRSATAIDGYNLGAAAAYNKDGANRPTFTSGCFYKFEPIVNGELKVRYYAVNKVFFSEGETTGTEQGGTRILEKTFTVKAGKTYYLSGKGGGLYLNSYTFTPKFFAPGTTTDQLTEGNFEAHVNDPAISAFPKLIDPTSEAQQNRVKFAGDRTKVHLYKNNDVEIIGTGTNVLIRGTVLDKNNEDGLVAYYYLDSYVLNVTNYEKDDQAYIETTGLTDDNYQFEFSGNIQAANGGGSTVTVQVKKDNGASENVTATITNNILYVPFASLEEGATYKMTIPENLLALTSEPTTKNSEIIRTFSVNKEGELQIKMIYPTDIATVGTSIVFATYVPDLKDSDHSNFYLNDNKKVKVVISAAGEEDMKVEGTFNKNQLAFKPTRTLSHNKTYSVTYLYNTPSNVITSNEVTNMSDVKKIYQVTKNKEFTFITGSSSGTQPQVVDNGTIPSENAEIPGSAYSSGRISFTFDQNVELEPYSTVTVTPVNGSESTTTATTSAPGSENNTLKIDSDGKTVYFEYGEDGLKYDLYYEVIIPANTVVGAGGLTNHEDIKLHFKMGQKPNSACKITTGTAFDGYPYSWDFQKFGNLTTTITDLTINAPDPTTGTSEEKAANKATATASRWQYSNSNSRFGNYFTNGMKYPQGEVATYYTTKNETPEDVEIAEMRGLRWSLAKMNTTAANNRIQIGGNTGPVQIVGGVHYLTIPNVPAGKKIYIKARVNYGNSSSLFNINSNNATFSEGYASESEKQIGIRTGSDQIYVVDVTDSGYDSNDVTFCLHDVTFYKIAVAADTKTFKKNYVKDGNTYATDCLGYDVRYDLLNAFTDHSVKAYYITNMENSTGNTATVTATEVNQENAVKESQGVLVVYQGAVKNDTEVPVFKTDVNTSAKEVVESGATSEQLVNLFKTKDEIASKPADHYLYVLSYTGSQGGGLGFYNYVGSAYVDRAAYLFMRKEWVGEDPYGSGTTSARKASLITIDADGVTTGVSEVETEKTPNNDGYFYNLNGMRVEHPKAGIYIRNGKKVVMK